MNDHPQTRVIVYDQKNGCTRDFHCDEQIAPILYKLNEIGATTIFSCQNLNNRNVVQFGFDHSVPKDILLHALTIISAAYKDRFICISSNEYFDPIIYAYKTMNSIRKILSVYKFEPATGSPEEVRQITLTQSTTNKEKP